jgi:glycosyltransferase involved in cell wall biosynthesis
LERPDIVHTHLFGADAWGRLAAFLARVPLIVTTEHNVNPDHPLVKRLVNRLFAYWTDCFIAVSEAAKRVMILKDRVSAQKIKTILNGIDLARVIPRPARPFYDRPRLIVVGRFYRQKGHTTLFNALAQVREPWVLRLVGTGPLERELRRLAESLHISSRIEWLGYRDDVPQLLSESDIFCFPSLWEGLGLVALEAAAAGVPVITSDLEPLREVLNEDDIRYIPTQDVDAWARMIEETLRRPAVAIERAMRAVPHVTSVVSIERMVEQYAELYRALEKNRLKKK